VRKIQPLNVPIQTQVTFVKRSLVWFWNIIFVAVSS